MWSIQEVERGVKSVIRHKTEVGRDECLTASLLFFNEKVHNLEPDSRF